MDIIQSYGLILVIIAAVFGFMMAYGVGANDVANAIGPVAAVVSVVTSGGEIASKATLAPWVLPLGAVGIVIGLATLGLTCRYSSLWQCHKLPLWWYAVV